MLLVHALFALMLTTEAALQCSVAGRLMASLDLVEIRSALPLVEQFVRLLIV